MMQTAGNTADFSATMDDNFADYRRFCANRMRRLERYKKAKSLCSLDDETYGAEAQMRPSGSGSTSALASEGGFRNPASVLRQPRATIDVVPESPESTESPVSPAAPVTPVTPVSPALRQSADPTPTANHRPAADNSSEHCSEHPDSTHKFDLLREKMISLMENDVRLLQQLLALGDSIQDLKTNPRFGGSQMSLNSLDGENEDAWPAGELNAFSSSLCAVTNLYVDEQPSQPVQYFSRKNSVLRIPIPPRSSNRMHANKHIPRRLSELSRSSRGARLSDPHSHHSEPSSSEHDASPLSPPFVPSTVTRLSNGSIDSGIRDESPSSASSNSPSPTFVQSN